MFPRNLQLFSSDYFSRLKMNRSLLIEAIRIRPSLWNKHDMNYHNSDMKQVRWEEISQEMGIVASTLKKRWELLRDGFRRELKKSFSKPMYQSSWPFYKKMLFIKDNMGPRGGGSFPQTSEPEDYETYDDESVEANHTLAPSTSDFILQPEICIKEEPLSPVEEKVFTDPGINEYSVVRDEDYHFLMSLLPSLKRVGIDMKLKVRIKMMEVLQNELEGTLPGGDQLELVDMAEFQKDVARM